MKKLNLFVKFDWGSFTSSKNFTATSCSPWKDQQGKVLGTRIETAITKDDTDYGEAGISNLFEKVTFKVPTPGIIIPVGTVVEPVNPVATVYGQYRNQLSVKADSVKAAGQANGGKA